MKNEGGQLQIDFDYDERSVRLAMEFGIMLTPVLAVTVSKEALSELTARMAMLATRRFKDLYEPSEPIRCHTCDELTLPKNRVRVVVCPRCAFEGRSPGSAG